MLQLHPETSWDMKAIAMCFRFVLQNKHGDRRKGSQVPWSASGQMPRHTDSTILHSKHITVGQLGGNRRIYCWRCFKEIKVWLFVLLPLLIVSDKNRWENHSFLHFDETEWTNYLHLAVNTNEPAIPQAWLPISLLWRLSVCQTCLFSRKQKGNLLNVWQSLNMSAELQMNNASNPDTMWMYWMQYMRGRKKNQKKPGQLHFKLP